MNSQENIFDPYNLLKTEFGEFAEIKPNGDIHLPIGFPGMKVGGYYVSMYIVYLKKVHYAIDIHRVLSDEYCGCSFFPYDSDIAFLLTICRGKQIYSHYFTWPDTYRLAAYISQITGHECPCDNIYNMFTMPFTRTIHKDHAVDIRPIGFPPKLLCSACTIIYDPKVNEKFPWQISISNFNQLVSREGNIDNIVSSRTAKWRLTSANIADIIFTAVEAVSQVLFLNM